MEPSNELSRVLQQRRRVIEGSHPTHMGAARARGMSDVTMQGNLRGTPTPMNVHSAHRTAGSAPGCLGNLVGENGGRRPSTSSAGGEPHSRRPSGGYVDVKSVFTGFDVKPGTAPVLRTTAPATVDRRGPSFSQGGLQPDGGDRTANNNLELRVPLLKSRNEDLNRQVSKMKERENQQDQGELQSLKEQRSLLLAETDQLIIETERMTQESEELKSEREFVSAEVEEVRAFRERNRELETENEWGRNRHSELIAEALAARGGGQGDNNSVKLSGENEALQTELHEMSQKVENLEGRLSEHDEQRAMRKESEQADQRRLDDEQDSSSFLTTVLRVDLQREKQQRQADAERFEQERQADAEKMAQVTAELARVTADHVGMDRETLRVQREEMDKLHEAARLQCEEMEQLREAARLQFEEMERLREANERLQLKVQEGQASTPQPQVSSSSGGSEGRLRAVMTCSNATSEELKSSIGAVEALVGEARRELERAEFRERRAAFEKLHCAIEKADEAILDAALEVARKAGVESQDIEKGEAKLLELRSMTEEQKAARSSRELEAKRKKDAFHFVKKDDVAALEDLIDSLEDTVRWKDWRDYAGRTLWKCSQDLRAEQVKPWLSEKLGFSTAPEQRRGSLLSSKAAAAHAERGRASISLVSSSDEPRHVDSSASLVEVPEGEDWYGQKTSPTGRTSLSSRASLSFVNGISAPCSTEATESGDQPSITAASEELVDEKPIPSDSELAELKLKAFRGVVQDNAEALEAVLELVPQNIWEHWQNKSGVALLTLSEERGSTVAYGVLTKALGMVQEQKRDLYEERENVWVYCVGDVQAKRATVMQDTPEEDDEILVEYWDGDEPASYVDRAMVRKDYFN